MVRYGLGWSVYFNDGSGGSFTPSVSSALGSSDTVLFGDINNDGISDAIRRADDLVRVNLGAADGSFGATASYSIDSSESMDHVLGDFNNDGNLDIATANYEESSISILLGNGDGTFQNSISTASSNDPVSLLAGDFNGDGNLDLLVEKDSGTNEEILFGNGQGQFNSGGFANYINGGFGDAADFNNDGVLDFYGTNTIALGVTTTGVAPLLEFSLNTIVDAKQALSQFNHKLNQLSEQRGQIGAFQSRVEVAEKVLNVSAESFKAAESRIRDADIAQESANLVRLQILQQASAAVLGQANQQPQLVLQLLGGNG